MSQFPSKNTLVFGVSADTVESHKQFAIKEHLNFPLLADPQKQMIAAYGVLGSNGYPSRVTFVIGPDGIIQHIDRNVSAQFSRQNGVLTTRHGANLALLLSDWRAQVGKPIPNFSLPDADGQTVALTQPGKSATVVIFMAVRSLPSQAYAERLRNLALDPAYKDVAFLGIDSNTGETAEAIKAGVERQQIPFPVGRDAKGALARHFNARVTPTVWIVNAQGIATYHGAIDDNVNPSGVRNTYLKDALDATLAGKPVTMAETKAVGAPITRSSGR